ncbi:MAG: cytidine deaminase [Phaeodactylibacter sp.]|nr:cytidine deaminase [Phaeodactylibacter sp.]MCB9265362.1 cytidine deaminase [Lewinellaceae bacterium]MCB9288584.1 cytidine deaminase [Lewinellaceae bacterium]
MKEITITTKIKVFRSAEELPSDYQTLLNSARAAMDYAYAPYSRFRVGAAVLLDNGAIVKGANQENAAYSMCICAERTALANASMQHPGVAINAIAVTVQSTRKTIAQPASPCGACRQVISEAEDRQKKDIAIILQGAEGEIYLLDSGKALLPIGFHGGFLQK